MGDRSKIEWTDATWNAVTGCTEVSAGCDNCYARTLAVGKLAANYGARLPVVDTPENRANTFSVRLWPERLEQPARWTRPRMIFVNSMSDFFHADVPEDYQRQMLAVMLDNPRHTYQILTKRPGRAARFFARNHPDPLPSHIWIGATVESQDVDFRIRQLVSIPAAVRFLSCEPLLGPLSLRWLPVWTTQDGKRTGLRCNASGAKGDEGTNHLDGLREISWVIVGGESGNCHARPRVAMKPEWVRSLRDECQEAGVAFHFKQWGGRTPKAGGRTLDGRTWDEFPTDRSR